MADTQIHLSVFVEPGAQIHEGVSKPLFRLALGFPAMIKKIIWACGQNHRPLKSRVSDLVRDCCVKNLKPEPLDLARKTLVK